LLRKQWLSRGKIGWYAMLVYTILSELYNTNTLTLLVNTRYILKNAALATCKAFCFLSDGTDRWADRRQTNAYVYHLH